MTPSDTCDFETSDNIISTENIEPHNEDIIEVEMNQLKSETISKKIHTFTDIILYHKKKLCEEYATLYDLQKIRISLIEDVSEFDKITYVQHIISISGTIKGYGHNWDHAITKHQFTTIYQKLYEAAMFMTPSKDLKSYHCDVPSYFLSAACKNKNNPPNTSKLDITSVSNSDKFHLKKIGETSFISNKEYNKKYLNYSANTNHNHFKYAYELPGYTRDDYLKDKEIPIFDDGNIICYEESDVLKPVADPIFKETPVLIKAPILLYNQYEVNNRVYTVKIPKDKIDPDSPLKSVVELLFDLGRNTLSSETNTQVSNFLKEQQETITEITECFPEYNDLNIEINTCLVAHGWKMGSGFQYEPNRKSLFNALNIICQIYLP